MFDLYQAEAQKPQGKNVQHKLKPLKAEREGERQREGERKKERERQRERETQRDTHRERVRQ